MHVQNPPIGERAHEELALDGVPLARTNADAAQDGEHPAEHRG